MLHTRKQVTIVTFFLLLLFVACSGGTSIQSKDAEEGKVDSQTGKDENVEPKYGGTFTIASSSGPDTLDPHRGTVIYTHDMAGLVYNKLLTYETGEHTAYNDYHLVPDLAERWEISDDGKVYTFYLREAYWHDIPPVNGRQLVAEDVVSTMERILNLPGHQAPLLSEVEEIIAEDERTVVITLKNSFAPFLNFMANHFMWILPQEAVDGEFDIGTMAIGTGPFMLESWEENVQATYSRNPHFYEADKPYLDKLEYVIIPDQSTRMAAFRTDQSQVIGALSPEEIDGLRTTNPDLVISEEITPTQVQVFMNMERDPFTDVRVRQAISLAIDRQNAVDRIFGGGEVSAPVNPSLGDWSLPLEEREQLQPYDPDKAKELMQEAGYPNGFETKIMLTDGYGEQMVRMGQWLVEDLKEIGIQAEIEMVELATFLSDRFPNKKYDMGVTFTSYFQEPDEWLRAQLRTGEFFNRYGISDPELDRMLDEQRLILDEEERKQMVYDIQRYVLQQVVNPIPLVTHYAQSPRQPYVRNWEPHASYGYIHMKNVWLDQ